MFDHQNMQYITCFYLSERMDNFSSERCFCLLLQAARVFTHELPREIDIICCSYGRSKIKANHIEDPSGWNMMGSIPADRIDHLLGRNPTS